MCQHLTNILVLGSGNVKIPVSQVREILAHFASGPCVKCQAFWSRGSEGDSPSEIDRTNYVIGWRRIAEEYCVSTRRTGPALVHEVTQPLAVIMGSAEYVQKMLDESPIDLANVRNALLDVMVAVRRVKALLEAGTKPSTTFIVPPNKAVELIPAIQTTLSSLAKELNGITVDMRAVIPGTWIRINAIPFGQILANLVANAAHALAGRKEREIKFDTSSDEKQTLTLKIIDTGGGIAPEHVVRVFEQGFTTKKERGGSGLGLAIVRDIMESIGARITVESTLDVGTTFSLTFPPALLILRGVSGVERIPGRQSTARQAAAQEVKK